MRRHGPRLVGAAAALAAALPPVAASAADTPRPPAPTVDVAPRAVPLVPRPGCPEHRPGGVGHPRGPPPEPPRRRGRAVLARPARPTPTAPLVRAGERLP